MKCVVNVLTPLGLILREINNSLPI